MELPIQPYRPLLVACETPLAHLSQAGSDDSRNREPPLSPRHTRHGYSQCGNRFRRSVRISEQSCLPGPGALDRERNNRPNERLYCLQMTRLAEQGRLGDTLAGLGKFHNTTRARAVLAEARDLLGGNGIPLDYQVIKHMVDLEAIHTFEGVALRRSTGRPVAVSITGPSTRMGAGRLDKLGRRLREVLQASAPPGFTVAPPVESTDDLYG